MLPGVAYGVRAPLLWYARRALEAAGRSVLAVTDAYEPGRGDALEWVEERASAALAYLRPRDTRPILIAKSISSLAAPLGRIAASLASTRILELRGADHSLEAPDVAESLGNLRRVAEEIERFAREADSFMRSSREQ